MKKTILVVDDDRSNLMMAQKLLINDYHVIPVISGKQALEYFSRNIPDLVLLDLKMPDMNGFEVMNDIKSQYKWSKVPIICLTASYDTATEVACFEQGATDFIIKPFEPKIMLTRIKRTLELEDYRKNLESIVRRQTQEITNIQQAVINSMANLIESRDNTTGEHVNRTSQYVRLITTTLQERGYFPYILTDSYVDYLCKAAPMHDIGKIAVPDAILKKPGKLTTEEFEIMKAHTIEGGKIIKNTMMRIENQAFIDIAYNVTTYHHEKWNGTGYPEGLKEETIPLSARIMAIADVFDALISKRCYKEPISMNEAFLIIKDAKAVHFDPIITDVFLSLKTQIENVIS